LRMNINFRFRPNSTDLDNKALADIHRALAALDQRQVHQGVVLLGFADTKGLLRDNCQLSEKRAQVVQRVFETGGVRFDKDQVQGVCTAMPVGNNDTESGRQKNRRVEVWVP